jgi:hypothetical protein
MDWRHMPEMLAAGQAEYNELKNLCARQSATIRLGSREADLGSAIAARFCRQSRIRSVPAIEN